MSGSTDKRLERRIIPRPQKLTRKPWYARGDRPLSIVQIVQLLLFSIRLSEVEEIDGFPSCDGKDLFQGTAFARDPGTPIAPLAEDDLPHFSIQGTRTLKGSCLLPGSWFEVVRSLGQVLRNSPRSNTHRRRVTCVIFCSPGRPNAASTTWGAWQTAWRPPSPRSGLYSRLPTYLLTIQTLGSFSPSSPLKLPVDRPDYTSARLSYGGGRCFGVPHACGPCVLRLLFATVRKIRLSPNKQSQGERAFRHPPAKAITSSHPCTEMPPPPR
ncbi:hypothetical protein LY76DRAFT_166083 [Colletotrichum caudatum]|nr:hypothetical protein LY76DRAFT_166083 [Colletotrichum caudatum]